VKLRDIFPWPYGWAEWAMTIVVLAIVAFVIYVGTTL